MPLQRDIYFIIDETTLTHQIQPKTIVYVRVHSWCCTVKGFGLMRDYMSDFPDSSDGKESACNEGDLGLITEWERSPGDGNGYILYYSYLENSTDRGMWQATDHGVAELDKTEQLTVFMMRCIHHNSITQSIFNALKILGFT